MAHAILETNWGWCGVVTSSRGVVRVLLSGRSRKAVEEQIGDTGNDHGGLLAVQAAEQIDQYLQGGRRQFTVPVDLAAVSPFGRSVLGECRQIPYGSTITYQQLATRIGRPRAQRAVGQSLAANPIPLIVPCHRIVGSGGSLGGFSGGLETKRRLLRLEGTLSEVITSPGE